MSITKNLPLLITLIIISYGVSAKPIEKNDSIIQSLQHKSYSFVIRDSPAQLSTMRQFDENYISANRFLTNQLKKSTSPKLSFLIQYFSEIFLLPKTHEEGHRSILTSMGIGSISQPFFNSKGAAYLKGVKDIDLINLRESNLPTYIRLHTAGLESDYMLANRMEETVMFGFDTKQNVYLGFLFRKLSLISYYTLSLIPSLSPQLEEESNELDRDIVGHDVYGAIKNLHRPNITFYRYTNYDDLTAEEKIFVKRVGYRALLNIANPLFIKHLNLIEKDNLRLSVSSGYSMCPFGDFIDENFWAIFNRKYNVHLYFRQFQNRNNWFLGGGLRLIDYKLSNKISTSLAGHFWNQPENLDFNTTESKFGGSGELLLKYIFTGKQTAKYSMSFDLGLTYKTKGFLPEEVIFKEHFGLRLGTTINLYR